ncbi:MAG: serine/threonine-protein kinase [bacterium]
MDPRNIQRRERQREFSQRNPRHWCPVCTSLVYEGDLVCLDCGTLRPDAWYPLRDSLDPFLGRTIDGRYLITKHIGQGGSGQVYRAVSYGVAREFAVKFIDAGKEQRRSQHVRMRLEREIEAMSRLRNPHVVPFYEVFEVYDQYLGVVMDFIQGETLSELMVNRGVLEVDRVCGIVRQVANGVHEAHEFGLVHRDLKPDNLMIEQLPAGGDFVHVLDFGIVRFVEMERTSNGFVGTPLYASPEQILGQTLDRRSDIYSLGAILFHALTGHPPFEASRTADILRMHTDAAPPALSDMIQGLGAYPELQNLTSQMLSKSRYSRPETMLEVVQRLDMIITKLRQEAWREPESETIDQNRREARKSVVQSRQTSQAQPAKSRGHARSTGVKLRHQIALMAAGHSGPILALTNGEVCTLKGKDLSVLARTSDDPTALAVGPTLVLMGSAAGQVHDQHGRVVFNDVRKTSVNALCTDERAENVFCGLESGRVQHALTSGENAWVWKPILSGPPVTALTTDAAAQRLVVAYKTREVELYESRNYRAPASKFVAADRVLGISLSPDGYLVALHMRGGLVSVHHLQTGATVFLVQLERPVELVLFDRTRGLVAY